MVLVGVSYGPAWRGPLEAQLATATDRVASFKRPAPPAPVVAKSAPEQPVSRRTGTLRIDSNPTGANVIVDGRDHGITPVTLDEVAVGSHSVVLRGAAGSIRRTVMVTAGSTTEVNEAIYSGWLHVSSPIELQISEGGRALRLDDSHQVLLTPGSHEVRFENRLLGFVETRQIQIRPGDTTSVSLQPPQSKLSVTASVPSEVLVDGLPAGSTPLAEFALDVGTREVTVRNITGGERRAIVTVTVEPVHLDVDFGKP
jgi:hypothetical protein